MNHEERMARADVNGNSEFFFSYVLQFDDGTFYVGHTNAPAARWTEHAAGQSEATADKGRFRVRMAMPFGTRKEAQYNEERMQAALKSGADRLVALIQVFDQLINVVRPQKTFSELQREEQEYESEMQKVFHHSYALTFNLGPRPATACGYNGLSFYSTQDWGHLQKMARDEDFTGNIYGRRVCRACLEHAPADQAEMPAK